MGLPKNSWQIAKIKERYGVRCTTIIVNQKSLEHIEHLAKSNGAVQYGHRYI